eukprot:CAMPEP_0172406104 /NCGR_PEP_ID=MMETSP1061-20121228/69393_1 /TAXON_ID=37318 /ORGANISM="Pseudo-nitzschia pungens, Strain cf. pungens" /LENGTH=838 /DNA_ID=CAMNT_0013141563 /DNA_START=75 /DNA_END=2591 /DNA_ORIENTATION=+
MVRDNIQEATKVEVSLAKSGDGRRKKRSCWFPFKKKINNRKSLTSGPEPSNDVGAKNWDIDGLENEIYNSNRKINYDFDGDIIRTKQPQQSRNRNTKKGEGSDSTGTVTDTSFLSQESQTNVGAGSFIEPQSSPSRWKFDCDENTSFSDACKANPNCGSEKTFMEQYYSRNKGYGELDNASSLNGDFDDDASIVVKGRNEKSRKTSQSTEQCLADVIPINIVNPEMLETQCWTNDVVEGGGFNCLEEGRSDVVRGRTRYRSNERDVAKGSQRDGKNVHPLAAIIQFISQDPEDANDGAPFRRVLCSDIPLRQRNEVLCRNNEDICRNNEDICRPIDQNQSINTHKGKNEKSSVGNKQLKRSSSEEEQPHFYIEVEAMEDQLDGVRDLEEIEAESDELEEEIAGARAASLADEDSAFTESITESSAGGTKRNVISNHQSEIPRKSLNDPESLSSTSKLLVQNIISGSKSNGSRMSERKNLATSIEKRNTSTVQSPHHNGLSRTSQHQKTDRRGKLISEMVTDRVLAMKMEDSTIDDSLLGESEEFMVTKTESNLRRGSPKARPRERQAGTINRQLRSESISNYPPPTIVESSAPLSAFHPVNVSELTDLSFNRIDPNVQNSFGSNKLEKKSPRQNYIPNAMQTERFDQEKYNSHEAEIGSSKIENSTSNRSSYAAFSPQRNHQSMYSDGFHDGTKLQWEGPSFNELSPIDTNRTQSDINTNFDESFWKEDTDDLKTEVFELYGSDNGSVFDDLNSPSTQDISPSFKKGESKAFRAQSMDKLGEDGGHGYSGIPHPQAKPIKKQSEFPRLALSVRDNPHYTHRHAGRSMSRTQFRNAVDY